MKKIKVGIEASNLNQGGGRTHILNILSNYDADKHDIEKIIIWGTNDLLESLGNFPWLVKKTNKFINGGILKRYFWLIFKSQNEFEQNCDILFAPGGLYFGSFRPFVSMSRNMLLFDRKQRNNQNIKLRCKLFISRLFQRISFNLASGIIFLSEFAFNTIIEELELDKKKCIKIPHGISSAFQSPPENRLSIGASDHFELLYVSHVYNYKHPWNVVEAVRILKEKGYNVVFKIIGGGDSTAINRLKNSIRKNDPENSFIEYLGNQPHNVINQYYRDADAFVYASTCENMPNILIEAMSSSLPIACSDAEPMPEFLENAGLYFDSLSIESIANAIEKLIKSDDLRNQLSDSAFKQSLKYNWNTTSEKTFKFIENIHNKSC